MKDDKFRVSLKEIRDLLFVLSIGTHTQSRAHRTPEERKTEKKWSRSRRCASPKYRQKIPSPRVLLVFAEEAAFGL